MSFQHISVLLEEAVAGLLPQPGGRYIDCTTGGGGHSSELLARSSPTGQLLGLDADPDAIRAAHLRLAQYIEARRCTLVQTNFDNLYATAMAHGFTAVDGILFDLGISSWQVDARDRGFSFESPNLDMRFDPTGSQPSAADLVNTLSEAELADIIWRLGEEPRSRAIARAIVRRREIAPITGAVELAELVGRAAGGRRGGTHPATRTFQALRIAVNRELEILPEAMAAAVRLLKDGGRLAVITFHSLEDRIVKRALREAVAGGDVRAVNKHVIVPSEEEAARNRRARSAKLRIVERTGKETPVSVLHKRRGRITWRGGMVKNDEED